MDELHVLHLYPNELNTYGDHGNALTIIRRAEWQGLKPVIHHHHPGADLPKRADLVIGGGGQDSAQTDVQNDILKIGDRLHKMAQNNIPMILICGTYQLFCHRYITYSGDTVRGIGIFDAETRGGDKRMIGNIMVESDFGILYGFENHSGQTYLGKNQAPLGWVIRGGGNNGTDKTEGARKFNVFGTYMHGPMLPNNPAFCDELIAMAMRNINDDFTLKHQPDDLSEVLRLAARRRDY